MTKEEIEKAKNYAIRYIQYRPRSEKEVFDKLKMKGFSIDNAEEIIGQLKNDGILDDEKFAKLWAEERALSKNIGRNRIKSELKQKGIDNTIIDEIIENIFSVYEESLLAEKFLKRKYKQGFLREDSKKIINALLRRGFSYKTAEKVLKNFNGFEEPESY